MARVRFPLLSRSATGTIGDALGYVIAAGAQVARSIARVRADARASRKRAPTSAQLAVRSRWSSGVAAWHALTAQQRSDYAAAAAPLALTGFNLFMRDYQPQAGTIWDGGATTWDGGATTWDN